MNDEKIIKEATKLEEAKLAIEKEKTFRKLLLSGILASVFLIGSGFAALTMLDLGLNLTSGINAFAVAGCVVFGITTIPSAIFFIASFDPNCFSGDKEIKKKLRAYLGITAIASITMILICSFLSGATL